MATTLKTRTEAQLKDMVDTALDTSNGTMPVKIMAHTKEEIPVLNRLLKGRKGRKLISVGTGTW